MAAVRIPNAWERRLRETEREKAILRAQLEEVRRWADANPEARQPLTEPHPRDALVAAAPAFAGVGVVERESATVPGNETVLDFAPGPEGLDTKRVVMPRLQRTDLLRPAIGGAAANTRLAEPEHDRFRSYLGAAGLKRVRETRQEQGSQRIRTIFMAIMVAVLGFILFQMVT